MARRWNLQASGGPLEDGEAAWLYDGDMGRLFIRRKADCLDVRFEPLNALARLSQKDTTP